MCATAAALQYLAHVLGWEQGSVPSIPRPLREAVDPDEQHKLQSLLAADFGVFRLVTQHVVEQQTFTATLA